MITKDGQIDTEYVGRKASAYTIVPDFRVGIGVEILKKEVKMIIVDGTKYETLMQPRMMSNNVPDDLLSDQRK